MSISTRTGISWSGGVLDEPTDTLVLTGKSYFVDVRVRKHDGKLDWAFAGTKSSKPGEQPDETISTWYHTIDSRSDVPVEESGVLFSDPSDSAVTIERGAMRNPETGRVENYEEVWHDVEPPSETIVIFLEKTDGTAIIAIIGARRLGVGTNFAWRMENGRTIFSSGEVEGTDVAIPTGLPVIPGDRFGSWVVREYWSIP